MCTIPPKINNKNKSNLLPFTGLVSQVTKYRNRKGTEAHRTRAGPPSGRLRHSHFIKVRRWLDVPGSGSGNAWQGRKCVLVVFKSGIRVFFFKQTWRQNGLGYTPPTGNKIQESSTIMFIWRFPKANRKMGSLHKLKFYTKPFLNVLVQWL